MDKVTAESLVNDGHTGNDNTNVKFTENSVKFVNCECLTVSQEGGAITIVGADLVRVKNGDVVEGFGKIDISSGVSSTEFALIAFKIGSEPHIWLIGNQTKTFTITYEGLNYTIDVAGLDWTTSAVIPVD